MTAPQFDLKAFLAEQENKTFLRFLTCGSVDDGKSTLIGRLLYNSKMLFEDHLSALEKDSRKFGTDGDNIDFALLVDGLEAEREQGITIDVAYRFFATDKRKFVVADTPGHEQYTRNMATGASNSDLAVVLIDARKGVLTQSRRHSYIASLLGIRHVVLAVNKIDLVGFSQEIFDDIAKDYIDFAQTLGFTTLLPIPISARYGDNVIAKSPNMPWYKGPALLDHLNAVDVESALSEKPFRMPVQWVNRPNLDFRGFSGTISSGHVKPGDAVVVAGSGRTSKVARIVTMDGDLDEGTAGEAVTITLADEIDMSRGDILAPAAARPEVSDQFSAHILWMTEDEMLPGRQYLLKIGAKTVPATVTELKHKVDVNTLDHLAGKTLALNEVGYGNISLSTPIAFDPYVENRDTGGFILIDRFTNATVAAGMIDFGLRRATNVHWQALDVNKQARSGLKVQKPCGAVVHRPLGLGQVDDRQSRREGAVRRRAPHLYPRRRQCASRAEPRSRLHRCRPGGEHPPRRRGVEAVPRCRPDRARLLHLAVPQRTPHGARACRQRGVHRDLRRYADRDLHAARSQGPLREGEGRRDQELHRHFIAL